MTGGVLWGVDRATFRTIVVASTAARRERFEEALEAIPLFKALTAEQRSSIAVRALWTWRGMRNVMWYGNLQYKDLM